MYIYNPRGVLKTKIRRLEAKIILKIILEALRIYLGPYGFYFVPFYFSGGQGDLCAQQGGYIYTVITYIIYTYCVDILVCCPQPSGAGVEGNDEPLRVADVFAGIHNNHNNDNNTNKNTSPKKCETSIVRTVDSDGKHWSGI